MTDALPYHGSGMPDRQDQVGRQRTEADQHPQHQVAGGGITALLQELEALREKGPLLQAARVASPKPDPLRHQDEKGNQEQHKARTSTPAQVAHRRDLKLSS